MKGGVPVRDGTRRRTPEVVRKEDLEDLGRVPVVLSSGLLLYVLRTRVSGKSIRSHSTRRSTGLKVRSFEIDDLIMKAD